jgi:hypothetical protein
MIRMVCLPLIVRCSRFQLVPFPPAHAPLLLDPLDLLAKQDRRSHEFNRAHFAGWQGRLPTAVPDALPIHDFVAAAPALPEIIQVVLF